MPVCALTVMNLRIGLTLLSWVLSRGGHRDQLGPDWGQKRPYSRIYVRVGLQPRVNIVDLMKTAPSLGRQKMLGVHQMSLGNKVGASRPTGLVATINS